MNELKPYERNIRAVIELARVRGIKVILTTQPHTTDSSIVAFDEVIHINQCNEIMRNLHQEYKWTYFVDLDKSMSGRMNDVFTDVGHVNLDGRTFKAYEIGKMVLGQGSLSE